MDSGDHFLQMHVRFRWPQLLIVVALFSLPLLAQAPVRNNHH